MSTSEKLTKSEQLNCTFDEIYQLLKDNVLMRCQTPQSRIGPEKLQLLHNVLTYPGEKYHAEISVLYVDSWFHSSTLYYMLLLWNDYHKSTKD